MNGQPALPNTYTPRDLLPVFYNQYRLGDDGGQSSDYVKIEFGKSFALYIPNFDARRKAVFKHDVHHIATGYKSTFKGETEIGAWEIGSGVRKYWIAFVLDIQAVMIGILFNPKGVFNAFVRGRHTKNLYANQFTDEQVMDMPIKDIQRQLLLDEKKYARARISDVFLFLLMLLIGLIYSILSILLLPFVLIYSIYIALKKKPGS